MKKALITGITGQDGSYLAELLLDKGYAVYGLVRPTSSKMNRVEHLYNDEALKNRFFLHSGDLCDSTSLKQIVEFVQPHEVYNLAAMSHMNDFVQMPELTTDVAATGTLRLLEAVRIHCPTARMFQATSSELFGNAKESPQTEETPFSTRSLYGIAKLYSFLAVDHYRKAHGLFACSGILFNHESPRRDDSFVSRKIIAAIARINAGCQETLIIGNLDVARDWGYAKDFVDGMWRMLQHETPEDFILATGRTTTVRKFVEMAFLEIGIKVVWEGLGMDEKGMNSSTGKIIVEVSSEFFRPIENNVLVGNPSKAKKKIGWAAETSLEQLVHIMMESDKKDIAYESRRKTELQNI